MQISFWWRRILGKYHQGRTKTEELVFDLGGNVAEWAITTEGKSRAMGGSAEMPVDAGIRARQPAAEYIGFRVIKGLSANIKAK